MNTAIMERTHRSVASQQRSAIAAMSVGMVLTVVATIVPFITGDLRDHIRDSYPHYTDARVDNAVTAWLITLTIIGILGVVGWLVTIWAVETRKRWAPWLGTALFVLGTSVALTTLLIKDTSGDTGLAPTLGLLQTLPCLAGAVAVALLWSRRSDAQSVGNGDVATPSPVRRNSEW